MVRRIITVIIPWILASTVGLLVLVHFFVSMPGLDPLFSGLIEWATIIAAFGVLLGLVNVARVHGRRVVQREGGWPYSLALLLSALVVLTLGMIPGSTGSGDPLVQWLFRYVLEPLATTFFSLLAFFLASAFFRALRLRNIEALLVTVSAAVVLLTLAGLTGLSLAFGVIGAKFDLEDPRRISQGGAGCLSALASIVFLGLSLALFFGPALLLGLLDAPQAVGQAVGLGLGGVFCLACGFVPLWLVQKRVPRLGEG